MIECRMTLNGLATGFSTGDRPVELNWSISDGVGQFERFDISKETPLQRDVGSGATVVMFVPGTPTELETAFADTTEALNAFKPDAAKSDAENDANREQLETALAASKSALEAGATVDLGWDAAKLLTVSGVAPTLLSVVASESDGTLTISSSQVLDGSELIVL